MMMMGESQEGRWRDFDRSWSISLTSVLPTPDGGLAAAKPKTPTGQSATVLFLYQ
jgi:hypothetical protein